VFTELVSERLVVRRFQDSDLAAFMAYRNDPAVSRYQNWDTLTAPRAQALLQEQRHLEPGTPGPWFQFALALKGSGQLVGDCGLQVLLQDARQAQVSVSLAPVHQGTGLATEALTTLLDYAFINLDLHRVIAVMDAENAGPVRLFERVGMRREGHFVKNVWFKGRWADEYLFALLQAEWLSRRGLPSMLLANPQANNPSATRELP
jgi:RimJ/RimL family protein N-acetyltransferase